jgi:hypothetical protein
MLNLNLTTSEMFLSEVLCHRDYLDIPKINSLFIELGEKSCFELCEKNNITCIAFDALSFCSELKLSPYWAFSFLDTKARITEYMVELDEVSKLLNDHKIPLIALKNSGIARTLYPFLGASPMGDLDVLVLKSDFRKAHRILIDHGYIMKFRSPLEEENLDAAERGGGAEYSVNLKSGHHLWFELQWRPIAGRWIRAGQEPAAEDLMFRSIKIDGCYTRLLSAEDNLMQVALHTAKHTYVRAPGFRLHTDVDRIVRSIDIDWYKFITEVNKIKVKTAVYLSLVLAKSLLRTPIPEFVLEELQPGRVKTKVLLGWLLRVGLFDPDGKKWSRVGYIIFVCLLYDNFSELFKSIFPSEKVIREQYPNDNDKPLFYLYCVRMLGLVKNRVVVK